MLYAMAARRQGVNEWRGCHSCVLRVGALSTSRWACESRSWLSYEKLHTDVVMSDQVAARTDHLMASAVQILAGQNFVRPATCRISRRSHLHAKSITSPTGNRDCCTEVHFLSHFSEMICTDPVRELSSRLFRSQTVMNLVARRAYENERCNKLLCRTVGPMRAVSA